MAYNATKTVTHDGYSFFYWTKDDQTGTLWVRA